MGKNYCFTPSWLSTLVTLILLVLLLYLGNWQLNRAEQKKTLEKEYVERSQMTLIDINHLSHMPLDLRFYRAKVTGHFDNQHQFLLDNKIYQHRIGYQVVTPFHVFGSKQVLLINRGWIPQGKDRQHLPNIQPVYSEVTLQGILAIPEKSFKLSGKSETMGWPKRVEIIDFAQTQNFLGKPVYSFILLLAPKQPFGYLRDWKPVSMQPSTHYGYAFQWFALAATLFIIFIVVNLHRKHSNKC